MMVGAGRGHKDQWKSLMETAVLKRTMGRLEKIICEHRDPGHGDFNVMLGSHLQGTGGQGQSGDSAGM